MADLHAIALGHVDLKKSVSLKVVGTLGIDDFEHVLEGAEKIVTFIAAVIRFGVDIVEAVFERALPDIRALAVVNVQPAL
jgi:hypothetical protein